MNTQSESVENRVTELEKNEAVNAAERHHINKRLESLDGKVDAFGVELKAEVKAIGVKMDEGFKEAREAFATPKKIAGGAFILAAIAWIVNGGLAI